jgi:hypothetical protein
MSKQRWYHGSLDGDIKNFRSFTHFGTRLAALHAIDHFKHYVEGECFNCSGRSEKCPECLSRIEKRCPTIYSIDIDLSKVGGIIELKDWGNPNAIGLINFIIEKYKKDGEGSLIFELGEIKNKYSNNVLPKRDFSLIEAWLLDRGIRVIRYLNKCEGRDGESSICIVDKSILTSGTIKKHYLTVPLRLDIEKEPSDLVPFVTSKIRGVSIPRLVCKQPWIQEMCAHFLCAVRRCVLRILILFK